MRHHALAAHLLNHRWRHPNRTHSHASYLHVCLFNLDKVATDACHHCVIVLLADSVDDGQCWRTRISGEAHLRANGHWAVWKMDGDVKKDDEFWHAPWSAG